MRTVLTIMEWVKSACSFYCTCYCYLNVRMRDACSTKISSHLTIKINLSVNIYDDDT